MLNQTSIIGISSSSSSSSRSSNDARTRLLERLDEKKRNGEKRTLENDDDDEDENDSLFHNKFLKNVLIVNEKENSDKKREIKRANENDAISSKSMITCKICLNKFYDVIEGETINNSNNNNNNNNNKNQIHQLELCKCKFCLNCLNQYICQCIENCDVMPIYCPDAKCVTKGTLNQNEIKYLLKSPLSSMLSYLPLINDSIRIDLKSTSTTNPNPTTTSSNINSTNICYIDCENNNLISDEGDALMETSHQLMSSESNKAEILFKRYLKLYENIEILRDPNKTHCPSPHCENVCTIVNKNKLLDLNIENTSLKKSHYHHHQSVRVTCEKCNLTFCSTCFKKWSDQMSPNVSVLMPSPKSLSNSSSTNADDTSYLLNKDLTNSSYLEYCECEQPNNNSNRMDSNNLASSLISNGESGGVGSGSGGDLYRLSKSSFEHFENIKRCPKCAVLIERADGCAQIMCKVCKHTFCFYCLASLDNDFLLKHFTKNGPCKGKLGHSRFSLFMHRLGVVAIFSGTIFLVIILSPIILFSLPCLIFSNKCRKTCYKFSTKFS